MSLQTPRRLVALLLIPACLGLAACGGGEEEQPDTQVAVPTQTATPSASPAADGDYKTVDGFLMSVDNEKALLIVEDGTKRTFWIAPEQYEQIGVPHLASHAGYPEIGFMLAYEERDGRDYLLGAQEIAPPFPFPEEGKEDR